MKRSDMIESIVYNALSWDGLDTSGVPVQEIASDVLSVCEKLGMLPPETNVEKTRNFGENLDVTWITKERVWDKE